VLAGNTVVNVAICARVRKLEATRVETAARLACPRASLGTEFGLRSLPTMATNVNAHITGTVWKIEVNVGDAVTEGQVCVILESMKMELPVEAPSAGTVSAIHVRPGQPVSEGDALLTLA
jgi:acetyl-CoA carboxylase biotin carboxyl carrier protein